MRQSFYAIHDLDANGLPAGGKSEATGIAIRWQEGPLGRGPDRQEPNGAFVETVIAIAVNRLRWYNEVNGGRFACAENTEAIQHLEAALAVLEERTARREAEQTEGTHDGN